jgi:putative transposase
MQTHLLSRVLQITESRSRSKTHRTNYKRYRVQLLRFNKPQKRWGAQKQVWNNTEIILPKYVKLMKDYVEKIVPKVGDTWRADEIYVKVKGNMKYLFAMMDDETRFWIAQEVADTKYKHDARSLLRISKDLMGKKPKTFITDGLKSYGVAYRKEFFTVANPRTKHIRNITIRGQRNNNKMERLNGEIRDREKTMRGLKKKATPILEGIQIFHNYIRPHESLDGKTPAEACGITVEGKNKWLTLIQNASKS